MELQYKRLKYLADNFYRERERRERGRVRDLRQREKIPKSENGGGKSNINDRKQKLVRSNCLIKVKVREAGYGGIEEDRGRQKRKGEG